MKPYRIKSGAFLIAATLTFPAAADWVQQLGAASSAKHFVQPAVEEVARAQALFLRVLEGETGTEIQSSWSRLGFDLVDTQEQGLMLLREKPAQRRGRGFFAFRKGGGSALQIPHAFKDKMTREIGIALFQQGHFSAAAWNTVPRRFVINGDPVDADMAHLTNTYFIAFSRAFAQHYPQGSILQLHGFEQGKRRHDVARNAAAILSNGTRTPPPALREFASCFAQNTGTSILTYPYDVHELGGTTNSIAAALREENFNRFFHLEMSREFRSAMNQNTTLQKTLVHCFENSL